MGGDTYNALPGVTLKALRLEVGQRFGRLEVVEEALRGASKKRQVVCRCDCGKTVTIQLSNLTTGNTTSCGCYRNEMTAQRSTAHGSWQEPEYDAWINMKSRCLNPNRPDFASYGGRGIRIDPRWIESFQAFRSDLGPRPTSGHSLERVDVNGNYEPGNVIWATKKTQARNTRASRRITANGQTKTVAEWAEELGVSAKTIYTRLARGWSEEESVKP